MASGSRTARLCMAACRRAAPQFVAARTTSRAAAFTTSARRLADEEEGDDADAGFEEPKMTQLQKQFLEKATPESLRQLDAIAKANNRGSIDAYLDAELGSSAAYAADRQISEYLSRGENTTAKVDRNSFWYDEDDPEPFTEEHDEFNEDDILAMAHSKLEEVREMRHYTRLAVWEMPLLSKLAKPFELPKDDQVLRWRYTTYMGESHQAESKVVVQFVPKDLGLTEAQTAKLTKLVGARYDPEQGVVKMSSERFEHQAQNKRYLQELIQSLIAEAKDASDTFADVALDTRHRYRGRKQDRPKPKFPVEWRMTADRQKQIAEVRAREFLAEEDRISKGLLVDGQARIDSYLMEKLAEEEKKRAQADAVAIPAGRGPAGRAAPRARR